VRHIRRCLDRLPVRLVSLVAAAWLTGLSTARAQLAFEDEVLAPDVSRAVQRLALLELRMQASPTPDDYRIAYHTLRMAQELTPDDVELARKIVAAAWSTGDSALLIDATRDLVRLDPTDTVAQLRLIVAGIARYQTVEDRIAAYRRFLGPAGDRLRPEVRSRLALDAALLLREQGDEDGFVELLEQALDLDGSNKAAAQLALTYFSSNVDDPVGLFEMQVNVLYADPIDPQVHLSMAHALADQGAMESAKRFFELAAYLFQLAGRVTPELEMQGLALRFQTVGPQDVLDTLTGSLSMMRQNARERWDIAVERGLPLDDFTNPDEVRLDPDKDKMRIICGMALGDDESVRAAIDDLGASTLYASEQLLNPQGPPAGYTRDQAVQAAINMLVDLQLYRLWADVDREQVNADVQTLRGLAPNMGTLLEPLEPWMLLRDDKFEQAIARVDELGVRAGRFGQIARALALEEMGRTEAAIDALVAISHEKGLAPVTAWIRHRVKALGASERLITREGVAIDALARDVPRFVDDMVIDPKSFMALEVETDGGPLIAESPFVVRVRVKNLAPIPLGVGSDRPINSRMLLQPHRADSIGFFFHQLYPEVVELNRRFRLDPRETLEAELRVDIGASGVVMQLNALGNHRLRWRVLQGFIIGALQTFRPGPLCLSAETQPVEIRRLPQATLSAEQNAVVIRSGPSDELPQVATLAKCVLLAWPVRTTPRPEASVNVVTSALTDRLQTGLPLERAYLLATMPASSLELHLMEFDMAALGIPVDSGFRASRHWRLVESLVLLTRVTEPDSPLISRAIDSGVPELVDLATLVKQRLSQNKPCYARVQQIAEYFPSAMTGASR